MDSVLTENAQQRGATSISSRQLVPASGLIRPLVYLVNLYSVRKSD
jgi:hypothetical protein